MNDQELCVFPVSADQASPPAGATERPLRICVVFDDDASATSAEVLIRQVASGYECDTRSFRFAELDRPTPVVAAARSASDSDIPVVSIIWQYTGLSARDIEQRLIYTHERALTTTVNNIQHIESTSYDGVGVIKVFFQPGVSPEAGVAQITAVSQTILKQLPPGSTPPLAAEKAWHLGGRMGHKGKSSRFYQDGSRVEGCR
jgi:hypothetical protein